MSCFVKIFMFLSLLGAPIYAGPMQLTDEDKAGIENLKRIQASQAENFKNGGDEEYKKNAPVFPVSGSAEQEYYKNGEMKQAAGDYLNKKPDPLPENATEEQKARFSAQQAAQDANKIFNTVKPRIDPKTDPALVNIPEIIESASEIVKTYEGCKTLPVGPKDVTRYREDSCSYEQWRDTYSFQCTRKLNVQCGQSKPGEGMLKLADFSISGGSFGSRTNENGKRDLGASTYEFLCAPDEDCRSNVELTNTISFVLKDIASVKTAAIISMAYDDGARLTVNGNVLYNDWPRKDTKKNHYMPAAIDIRQYLKTGSNSIQVDNKVSGGGGISLRVQITETPQCTLVDNWIETCEQNIVGSKIGERCVDSANPKMIPTPTMKPVNRTCWEYEDTYTYIGKPNLKEDPKCENLRKDGCTQTTDVCNSQGEGYCSKGTYSYKCPYLDSKQHVEFCGSDLVCPDGGCTEEMKAAAQDEQVAASKFAETVVKTETAKKIVKESTKNCSPELNQPSDPEDANSSECANQEDTFKVFSGKPGKCGISSGFGKANDCCKSGGWVAGLGVGSCKPEERTTAAAIARKLVYYVGKIGKKNYIGVDYHVYCTYDSILARIVATEAYSMLGYSWGSPKDPQCGQLTVKDLSDPRIKWNEMDFSELVNAVKATDYVTPNPMSLQNDVDAALAKLEKEMIEKYKNSPSQLTEQINLKLKDRFGNGVGE